MFFFDISILAGFSGFVFHIPARLFFFEKSQICFKNRLFYPSMTLFRQYQDVPAQPRKPP